MVAATDATARSRQGLSAGEDETAALCQFLSGLQFDAIPEPVILSAKHLFIDWLGSALAGANAKPTLFMQDFAHRMGPVEGPCTDLAGGRNTSAFFAAMINAAASHVVEQDDLHNSSVLHPATVVFSALLAAAEDLGASGVKVSGRDVLVAAIAGYEAGVRIGEFLGRSHYVHFHTTGTVGTLAAAAAVGRLIGLDAEGMRHALGTAGTKAAGLWEFLVTAADSKQVHTAGAASSGLMAAYAAREGITGARRIFDGAHGMGAAMSTGADASWLSDGLGSRWATVETSYKWHASCRHTHPAADALLAAMSGHGVTANDIAHITARVHAGAIDVLGPVNYPTSIHQAKFCMGAVLGLIAVHGKAGLREFDACALTDPEVGAFFSKVTMELDPEIDAAYPARWMGHVILDLKDGRRVEARIEDARGDPGNPLSEDEIIAKARSLALYGGKETSEDVNRWITNILVLDTVPDFSGMFSREQGR